MEEKEFLKRKQVVKKQDSIFNTIPDSEWTLFNKDANYKRAYW